ncbi:MAG: PadR family transcriptional regulator [Treponema sp.]|jgi:DNA-binding PadR family transcriptional regulator|nr:PadR family transcriptional regulator [Treponema sp.]
MGEKNSSGESGGGRKLSPDLLRGHTETIVLGILHRGDAYGFEIYNTILERTGEQYELKETTLYSSYKRLEQEGCITSYWGDETQGARRRYYRLTGKGRKTYRQNMEDWAFTRKILDSLMSMGIDTP